MKDIVPLKYIDSNGESLLWLSNISNVTIALYRYHT